MAPESNILCFRSPGSDAHQLELRKRILATGDFYIASTQFQNKRYLRLVFMNPDTKCPGRNLPGTTHTVTGPRLQDVKHDGSPVDARRADLHPVADQADRLLHPLHCGP